MVLRMTTRYAIIRSGLVENMTRWDGEPDWTPPDGAQAILAPDNVGIGWTYDGTEWTAPEPPPAPVPEEVRQAQARRALLAVGLLDDVEAAVAAASRDIQIAWEYEPNIRRDSPMVAALAPAIGLTDAQLDDLFRAAAEIT